jgi:DNA-binding CsgD family transcriptional regulator/tetratricopeptide (TPR) repeat protein
VPLLERDEVLDGLRAEQRSAAEGHGRVVLVSGEAGAGKTAVVRAAFGSSVWGYCEALATPRPLGPFRDIATELWPHRPSGADAISVADRLLRFAGSAGPVFVVEDAHWIDTASADVIRFLGRRIGRTSGLLVVIARDERPPALSAALGDLESADAVTRIGVPPLSSSAVGLLAADTGVALDDAMRLTDGNAFLVTQLLADPSGHASSLLDATTARVARLSSAAHDLVERLAVLPGRIPADVIGTDWPSVDELRDAGLVGIDDGAVEFRHELLRLAIEDGVPPGRRRQLHAAALERLQRLPAVEPATIAHHARLAHRPDVASIAEADAARRAAAFGSHLEAVAHFRRAVADARDGSSPADRVRLLLLLAEQLSATAHDDEAREVAEQAVQLSAVLDDPLLRSDAVRVRSRLEPSEDRALELALLAVELAEQLGPSTELAAAVANIANHRMISRDLDDAIGDARRSIDTAREVGDIGSEFVATNALGSALLLRGDADGEAHLRRAIHLGATHGHTAEVGRAYANLVSASGEARDYGLSERAAREAVRYFTARDLDGHAFYARAWHARCLFEQGRWTEASAAAAQILEAGERTNGITRIVVCCLTVRLAVRRGEAVPEDLLDEADRIARSTGALQRVAPVVATSVEADRLAGRPPDIERLEEVHALAVRRRDSWAGGELAVLLRRSGAPAAAEPWMARPFLLHLAADLRGAAEAWTAIGCPYEAADALSDSDDEQDLRRALRLAGELGALPLWHRAAARLRATGAASIPRAPRTGTTAHPDGLTDREAEVLGWLVRGATDAEIADHLHLSTRTVEHHVAAVLRKKGASSRRVLRSS